MFVKIRAAKDNCNSVSQSAKRPGRPGKKNPRVQKHEGIVKFTVQTNFLKGKTQRQLEALVSPAVLVVDIINIV